MARDYMDKRIKILQGDITLLDVDAIVNAANTSLLEGGGVDGAIHNAAGPELMTYNQTLGGCATGDAKISPGYNLKARHVISTVGPVWQGGAASEDELLSSCYRRSLEIAAENGVTSIAFPCISTGIYGFPFERAEWIAISTINKYLLTNNILVEAIMIAFKAEDYENLKAVYTSIIDKH